MADFVIEKRIKEFEKLGFGMFIHWGLYSLLARGEWIMEIEKIPLNEYQKLTKDFNAKDFNAGAIASLACDAGIKYITLTTRHHDGFSLYDTCGLSSYDAVHSAAKRDLIAEFVEGCRSKGIIPFLYHTTLDWSQESFRKDFNSYLEYLRESVRILCKNYGKIGGLWFDGNWSKPDADWQEDKLYGLIRELQPDAIIVNNTGLEAKGKRGHREIDSVTFEQGLPVAARNEKNEKYIACEMCQTMNSHWGFSKSDFNFLSPKNIIENLCSCRKVGANYLLNIGLEPSGKIPAYESASLSCVGQWIKDFSSAIYQSLPSEIKGMDRDFALETEEKIYLFIFNLGVSGDSNVTIDNKPNNLFPRVFKGITKKIGSAYWLDNHRPLHFFQNEKMGDFCINVTPFPYGINQVVRVAELSKQK